MIAMEEVMKTGTTTVGLVCKDGIVLAADKRATAGYLIAQKDADKIHQITENIAVTIAGTVSDAQLLVRLTQAEKVQNRPGYHGKRGSEPHCKDDLCQYQEIQRYPRSCPFSYGRKGCLRILFI